MANTHSHGTTHENRRIVSVFHSSCFGRRLCFIRFVRFIALFDISAEVHGFNSISRQARISTWNAHCRSLAWMCFTSSCTRSVWLVFTTGTRTYQLTTCPAPHSWCGEEFTDFCHSTLMVRKKTHVKTKEIPRFGTKFSKTLRFFLLSQRTQLYSHESHTHILNLLWWSLFPPLFPPSLSLSRGPTDHFWREVSFCILLATAVLKSKQKKNRPSTFNYIIYSSSPNTLCGAVYSPNWWTIRLHVKCSNNTVNNVHDLIESAYTASKESQMNEQQKKMDNNNNEKCII